MLKTCSELWVCRDHRFSCLHSLKFFSCQLLFASHAGKHQLRKIMCTLLKLWSRHLHQLSKLQKNTQIPPPSNIFQKLESLEKVRNTESINYINSGCPSYIHSQLYVKYSAHINSVLGSNFCKCNLY